MDSTKGRPSRRFCAAEVRQRRRDKRDRRGALLRFSAKPRSLGVPLAAEAPSRNLTRSAVIDARVPDWLKQALGRARAPLPGPPGPAALLQMIRAGH